MSESESAVDRGNDNVVEDDCPLCLEPLPPFWDVTRRLNLICCHKQICRDCSDKKAGFLDRAYAEGSFGKEEEQLASVCPLCRTKKPTGVDSAQKMMNDKFEEGRLPLNLYWQLGLFYLEEGAEIDAVRGTEILMLGAEKGDPECQYSLGINYAEGKDGLPKSLKDAKRWYLTAAEQGHAIAEYNLAVTLKEEGNDAECLRHLRGSALKSYDEACLAMGKAHYRGEHGAQQSFEEAIRVLTPAAERGHPESMSMLGLSICTGFSAVENPRFTEGFHLMRRAAGTGDETCIKDFEGLEKWASSKCFMCYTEALPEKALLRCSRCRAAWYCSKDCQRRHWKAKDGGHKERCIKWG